MKKVLKSRIFIVIITMIICISGTLYGATKYNASEVLYNASNGETMNVNEALNKVYENMNKSNISYADFKTEGRKWGHHSNYQLLLLLIMLKQPGQFF